MKLTSLIKTILVIIFSGVAFQSHAQKTLAAIPFCTGPEFNYQIIEPFPFPSQLFHEQSSAISITLLGVQPNSNFDFVFHANMPSSPVQDIGTGKRTARSDSSGRVSVVYDEKNFFRNVGRSSKFHYIMVRSGGDRCALPVVEIIPQKNAVVGRLEIKQRDQACCFDTALELEIRALDVKYQNGDRYTGNLFISVGHPRTGNNDSTVAIDPTTGTSPWVTASAHVNAGESASIKLVFPGSNTVLSEIAIPFSPFCSDATIDSCDLDIITSDDTTTLVPVPYDLCGQISGEDIRTSCLTCYHDEDGIWTAVGCIPKTDTTGIVKTVVRTGLGLAGGVALIMILVAAFMFSTSQGEPKRTSEAREILSSAIIGLVFIIFSVTILQFIGYSVFKLPGFGG